MTVGFFSPLPPKRSGVADHAAALLGFLREHGQVDLNPARSSVNLYHLGNNQLHAAIYTRALQEPGVVVLHDALLHHFLLGSLTESRYIEEFVFNYGPWSAPLAQQLWLTRTRSAADPRFFEYAMLKRICETSRAVIVHNPEAARKVHDQVPNARLFEVPLLFDPATLPCSPCDRDSLAVSPKDLLLGIFGHLRESKRIMPVLRVLSRMQDARVVLLLAGDSGSEDLEKAVSAYTGKVALRRICYSDPSRFHRLCQSVDLCINLRYPSAGETSAIGVTMMGLGKCVVFSESLAISRYPADACVRSSTGIAEEEHLEANLRWLALCSDQRRQISLNASNHIALHHFPQNVAALYWQILKQFQD